MFNKFSLILLSLSFCLIGSNHMSFGQLSAFTNFQNQFMAFENGMIRRIDYLVPIKFGVGRNAIAFMDNSRNFKIYSKGGVTQINAGLTNAFQVTDNLITYQNATALSVWDRGQIQSLSRMCNQFYTGDSLVIFFEGVQKEFRAYYNFQVYPIEGFLAGATANMFNEDNNISSEMNVASGQLSSIQASDNIAAYVNFANQFRIFYHGKIIAQDDYLISNFGVGRNTVAYVDANQQFKVFHKGITQELDNFPPNIYAVGDDLVAFVGYDGYFKIFHDGQLYTIGYFDPEFVVKDNVVAFKDATGYFSAFYKGKVTQLENYYPSNFKAAYNSIAYVNRANVLRLFSEGNIYDVTNAEVADWRLDYDVIQYRFGGNMFKVFYKGTTY